MTAETTKTQRLDAAFENLWAIYSGPTLSAWIELTVAARTDPDLQTHMRQVSERMETEAEETLRTLFGIAEAVPSKASVRMVLSLLDGLAFRSILQDEDAVHEALTVFRILVTPWLGKGQKT